MTECTPSGLLSAALGRNQTLAGSTHFSVLQPPCCAWFLLIPWSDERDCPLPMLSRPRRPRRSGKWTETKAVTFIVTLAASQSVTLAARRAGISRKSAYALKSRDPAFAAAWSAALGASAGRRREGNKVSEACDPRFRPPKGDSRHPLQDLEFDAILRERFFTALSATRRDSAAPAYRRSLARPRPVA